VIWRAAYVAAVLLGLGISRLLPEHGVGLFVRLGAATLVVLLPGRLIARALGLRSLAATLAWSLAALSVALGAVFLARTSFAVALWILFAIGAAALLVPRRELEPRPRGKGLVAAGGLVLGALLWHIAPKALVGDAPMLVGRLVSLFYR
jgi:hypothetical protein